MSRPSFPDSASNPFSRFLAAVLRALFVLGALALTILLLLAVAVMVIVSLLAAWLAGRRASPADFWQQRWSRWGGSARWPRSRSQPAATPADAVQDIAWRDVPANAGKSENAGEER